MFHKCNFKCKIIFLRILYWFSLFFVDLFERCLKFIWKKRTCQVSESLIITPFFPFSFLLIFFKALYIWIQFVTNSSCGDNNGHPTLLSVHRVSWIGTACSKRQAVYASAKQKYEGGHWGRTLRRKTHCISRCVQRHICNKETLLFNKVFFFLKDNECYNQQSLSSKNGLISFCSSVWYCLVLLSYEDLGTWRHFSGFILPNLSFFLFVCLHLLFSLPYAMQNGWQGEDGVEKGGEGGGERERWRLLEGCKVLTE